MILFIASQTNGTREIILRYSLLNNFEKRHCNSNEKI